MKKNMSILSLLLGLFVSIPFLSSCGDDDDDYYDNVGWEHPIIGKWCSYDYRGNMIDNHNQSDYQYQEPDYTELDVQPGACRIRMYDSYRNCKRTDYGTYKIRDNSRLLVWWDSMGDGLEWSMPIEINGDEMVTGGDTHWKRI